MSKEDKVALQREVAILQKVDHPNIVKYLETYDDDKFLYLIMELCEGGELSIDLIKNHSDENPNADYETQVALYFKKIILALEHCHSQGICHRDLKPSNIMFGSDKSVKLIDFGFAINNIKKNKQKAVVGTPYYIGPEVITGFYGKECDIWSLGVCLVQILDNNNMPFNGDSVE